MLRLLMLILLSSCKASPEELPEGRYETIQGRLSDAPLYHAFVPHEWKRLDETESRQDSREPIASWKIENVAIFMHNFDPDTSILPEQQVERWKRQMGPDHPFEIAFSAHSGFYGERIKGVFLAYAFSLDDRLKRKLKDGEGRADWTIKASGPIEELWGREEEIDRFVETIELIEPVR